MLKLLVAPIIQPLIFKEHIFLKLFTVDATHCTILPNNMAFRYCATWCVPDL